MIIETKYDAGHQFWVPRCRKTFKTETLTFEGEEWKRQVPDFHAYAKKKEIVGIDIRISANNNIMIFYSVVDFDKKEDLSSSYAECDITHYSEEEAIEIAEKYKMNQQEYFGN
jgi:hypothetical protein